MEHVAYLAAGATEDEVRGTSAALEQTAQHLSPAIAREVRFHVENAVPRVLAKLRLHGADALILDARREQGSIEQSESLTLMRALFGEHEVAGPVRRARTWLVVRPDGTSAELAFEAGRARLGGALAAPEGEAGWVQIWRQLEGTVRRHRGGKIALCLAGGGIEGGIYELGVLRALQYFLPDYRLQDVDILCGISAGSLIAAFLANGLSPDEVTRGMFFGDGRLDRLRRWDTFDPNVREVLQRCSKSALGILRGKATPAQALLQAIPSGAFAGQRLHRWVSRQLHKPGMTARFTELPHKLFVGATDVDTARHVVFGSEGWEHVPIPDAVRASSALTPFYAPHLVDGRYFMDGGFTRTTNIRVAVEQGATLVILLDPLVPIASEQPGYVADKGAVLESMQAVKALIHGRFGQAAQQLQAEFPHVAIHLFQPDGASMRLMAGSPMKFFYRTQIDDVTYRETIRSIRRRRFASLQSDFARHGIAFVEPEADAGSVRRDMFDEADEVLVA